MKIVLANPRGFCAGVDRAVHIVEKAIEKYGTPIYVRHEIVHNKYVVDSLRQRGAIFVEEVDEVPEGSTVIFSAHGAAAEIYRKADDAKLRVIDATCPLVKKVHNSARRHEAAGSELVLIGHAGHAEVQGTIGQVQAGKIHLVASPQDVLNLDIAPDTPLAYITQTTLSVEETQGVIAELKTRFPHIKGPEKGDLCYATTNRQAAVRELCSQVDLLLVVGASNSSNSNRLRELGEECGVPSYLISEQQDIADDWFEGVETVGISSGASAPEVLVRGVIERLQSSFPVENVENLLVMEENVRFQLPEELKA